MTSSVSTLLHIRTEVIGYDTGGIKTRIRIRLQEKTRSDQRKSKYFKHSHFIYTISLNRFWRKKCNVRISKMILDPDLVARSSVWIKYHLHNSDHYISSWKLEKKKIRSAECHLSLLIVARINKFINLTSDGMFFTLFSDGGGVEWNFLSQWKQ